MTRSGSEGCSRTEKQADETGTGHNHTYMYTDQPTPHVQTRRERTTGTDRGRGRGRDRANEERRMETCSMREATPVRDQWADKRGGEERERRSTGKREERGVRAGRSCPCPCPCPCPLLSVVPMLIRVLSPCVRSARLCCLNGRNTQRRGYRWRRSMQIGAGYERG